jgi:hypothetical protein
VIDIEPEPYGVGMLLLEVEEGGAYVVVVNVPVSLKIVTVGAA